MDGTGKHAIVHSCPCSRCRSQPDGPTAKQHRALNDLVATLDEKSRRLVVGLLAKQHGRGGITRLARITGLSRDTIRRGQRELSAAAMELHHLYATVSVHGPRGTIGERHQSRGCIAWQ